MSGIALVKFYRLVLVFLAALSLLASCDSTTGQLLTGFACPVGKIAFTQDTGCVNDGSIEFCVPADDKQALATILRIAPRADCFHGRGRAQCDESEYLCMVDTEGMCSDDSSGAMNDDGWRVICDLASLSFVREIVPTWYE